MPHLSVVKGELFKLVDSLFARPELSQEGHKRLLWRFLQGQLKSSYRTGYHNAKREIEDPKDFTSKSCPTPDTLTPRRSNAMQKLNCTIPPAIQTISVSLAGAAPDGVAKLTDEDRRLAASEKEREQAWVKEHFGDFTDAEHEGKWRDGQRLFESQSLYTGSLVDDLIAAGYSLVDAHSTEVILKREAKPKTVFIFSKVLTPTARVKENSLALARGMLRRKWYKGDGYLNFRRESPNIQILVAGTFLDNQSISDLRLSGREAAVPSEA